VRQAFISQKHKKDLKDRLTNTPNQKGLFMQIKGLHKNIYRLADYALSQEKCEQQRKQYESCVWKWRKLKSSGLSDQDCQAIVGISRPTYYRYEGYLKELAKGIPLPSRKPKTFRKALWGESERQCVLKLRRENPTYGKAKIAVLLKRDEGITISESTVGRILKNLITRGLVQPSCSASKRRKKRRFKGHAKRWQYGMKGKSVGEMIQIDHMTVTKNKVSGKHFQAWDPASRFIYANLYGNAKSKTAKKFLLDLRKKVPFSISSIQVDGGSEFMKEFEMACQELKIPLYVLPPKRPQYNGGVERGNRSFREEFYSQQNLLADSMQSLRYGLSKAVTKYNTYRPHFSLKGLTPMEYIRANYQRSELSHS
jgi:transposase InsO family protein